MSKLKLSFSINMFLPLCYQYLIKVPQSMWLLDPFWLFFTLFFSAAKSLQSCPTLCDPIDGSPPGSPSLGFSRQEHWSALPFPSPMHESEKWKWGRSVVSDSQRLHGLQPTGLLHPWIFQATVLEWAPLPSPLCMPSPFSLIRDFPKMFS